MKDHLAGKKGATQRNTTAAITVTITDATSGQAVTLSLGKRRWEEVRKFLSEDIRRNLEPEIDRIVTERYGALFERRRNPPVKEKPKERS